MGLLQLQLRRVSIVTSRSLCEICVESAFSMVVLPVPVPPETIIEMRPFTAAPRTSAIGALRDPNSTSRSMEIGFLENLRIEISGPSTASGRITALTRLPSASRASTMGWDSSTRRPTWATILLRMRSRCASSLNFTGVSSSWPARST